MKFLVIDESVNNRETACQIIDALGFDSEECSNPFHVYKKIIEGHYDGILLDWHHENGYSGLDFIKHLRGNKNCCDLPVFIYTDDEDDEYECPGLSRTTDGFITKPTTIDVVNQKFTAAGLM